MESGVTAKYLLTHALDVSAQFISYSAEFGGGEYSRLAAYIALEDDIEEKRTWIEFFKGCVEFYAVTRIELHYDFCSVKNNSRQKSKEIRTVVCRLVVSVDGNISPVPIDSSGIYRAFSGQLKMRGNPEEKVGYEVEWRQLGAQEVRPKVLKISDAGGEFLSAYPHLNLEFPLFNGVSHYEDDDSAENFVRLMKISGK